MERRSFHTIKNTLNKLSIVINKKAMSASGMAFTVSSCITFSFHTSAFQSVAHFFWNVKEFSCLLQQLFSMAPVNG